MEEKAGVEAETADEFRNLAVARLTSRGIEDETAINKIIDGFMARGLTGEQLDKALEEELRRYESPDGKALAKRLLDNIAKIKSGVKEQKRSSEQVENFIKKFEDDDFRFTYEQAQSILNDLLSRGLSNEQIAQIIKKFKDYKQEIKEPDIEDDAGNVITEGKLIEIRKFKPEHISQLINAELQQIKREEDKQQEQWAKEVREYSQDLKNYEEELRKYNRGDAVWSSYPENIKEQKEYFELHKKRDPDIFPRKPSEPDKQAPNKKTASQILNRFITRIGTSITPPEEAPKAPAVAAPVIEIPTVSGNCQTCGKLLDPKTAVVVTLLCPSKHQFHFDCIEKDMKKEQSVCPKCKEPVNRADAFIHYGKHSFQSSKAECTICGRPLNPFIQRLSVLACGDDKHIFHTPCIVEHTKLKPTIASHALPAIQAIAEHRGYRLADFESVLLQNAQAFPMVITWVGGKCPLCQTPLVIKKTIGTLVMSAEEKAAEVKALFAACNDREGKVAIVREIIRRQPQLLNERYQASGDDFRDRGTPLYLAANSGNENVLRFLLNPTEADGKKPIDLKGIKPDINVIAGKNFTPLFRAAASNYPNILNLLLGKMTPDERRFALSCRSSIEDFYTNYTPLHRALSKGYHDIVKRLLPLYQIDPTLRPILTEINIYGQSLIDIACEHTGFGFTENIRLLLDAGVTQMRDKTRFDIMRVFVSRSPDDFNRLFEKTSDEKLAQLFFDAIENGGEQIHLIEVLIKKSIARKFNFDVERKNPDTSAGQPAMQSLLDFAFANYVKNRSQTLSYLNIIIMKKLLVAGARKMSPETRAGLLKLADDKKESDIKRLLPTQEVKAAETSTSESPVLRNDLDLLITALTTLKTKLITLSQTLSGLR